MVLTPRVRRSVLPAVFGVLMLSACDDVIDPAADFDAHATAEAMESMVVASEDMGDAFGSMQLAGAYVFQSAGAELLPTEHGVLPRAAEARSFAMAAAAGFFASNHLGVTFVYHEGESHYVMSDEPGAPADGVRIIYYAMDPVLERPASPLVPLGYVDLRDLSTAASQRLGVAVVGTGGDTDVRYADYYIDVSTTQTETDFGATFASVGFLSNGTDQLNFDLTQAVEFGQTSATFTQDYTMGLDGTDLEVSYAATLSADYESEESAALDMTASVTNGAETVVFHVLAQDETLDGTITYNNVLVANVGGTFDAPAFTDPAGNALEPAQLEGLHALFEAVGRMFEVAEGIFGVVE